jgi:hypothetical protein
MLRLTGGVLIAAAIIGTLGWSVMTQKGPESAEPVRPRPPRPPQEQFAADRAPLPGETRPAPFDGQRALQYLEAICKIGPRISGSEGMKQQQQLLKVHFEKHGAAVELQTFTARQLSKNQPIEMANLIATWHPDRPRRVILCCHYDTRPIADQEIDRRRWTQPFLSANDGGSGVAWLMELAHHLKELPLHVGVDFVIFDGEEYIFDPEHDKYFFGSEHFAQNYRKSKPKFRYIAAVLLDMIAGKTIRFPIEQHSWVKAGLLVQEIWKTAAELKSPAFVNEMGPAVRDDHLALNAAGIPAVDIIDFDYPHWHKLSDTPANCSGDSLAEVARVLTVWLQRVK